MSTLIDLFPEFQERIPEDRAPLIFSTLNRAIATISKRLYIHESDLIRGELAVSIWGSRVYTKTTIGFAAGTEGAGATITDSAGLLIAGAWGVAGWGDAPWGEDSTSAASFIAGMHVSTTGSGNPGPFLIDSATGAALTLDEGDVLTTTAAGPSVVITSENAYGDMPSDFWGLLDKPYLDGKTYTMDPLPNQATKLSYPSPAEPRYYELIGQKLYVYPETAADYTVKGPYWMRPTKITTAEQTLPYNELLDDALIEVLFEVMKQGPAFTAARYQEMEAFLFKAVDLVVTKRPKKAAQTLPGGLRFDDWLV
jgi:hypothetical protein